nr:structural protein [Vibrio cholerae]
MALSAVVLMTVKSSSGLPRGIRNNNPGNIEDKGTAWRGRTGNDGRFIIFDSPVNGIRAMYRTLMTYRNKYVGELGIGGAGFDSVGEIIRRWAPPVGSFNGVEYRQNTQAYINHVCKILNCSENDRLPLDKYPELIKAIIKHENGLQPYSDEVIHAGIAAA